VQVFDAADELAAHLAALGVGGVGAAVQLTLMRGEGDLDVDGLDGAGPPPIRNTSGSLLSWPWSKAA
jgi:hypothetical protein